MKHTRLVSSFDLLRQALRKGSSFFYPVLFVLLVTVLMLFTVKPSGDPDFLRHIKLGELMVNTGNIVRQEPFVFPTFHKPLYSPNWLFELILYLVYKAGGFMGLALFKTSMAFLVFYFILKTIQNKRAFWILAFAVIYIFSSRLLPRPDLISMLFFCIYIFLLMRHEEKTNGEQSWIGWRSAFLILCIHVLWVNIHTFYVLGLIFLFLYLGGRVIERKISEKDEYKWLGFLLVLSCAALLNPDGYRNFQVILDQVSFARKGSLYNALDIVEMRSPLFFSTPAFKLNFLILILVSAASFVFDVLARRRINRFVFIWIFFLLFSLLSLRSTVYFCFLAVPLAAYNFYGIKSSLQSKTVWFFQWLTRRPVKIAGQFIIISFLLFAFRVPLYFVYQDIKKQGIWTLFETMTGHSFNEASEPALQFIRTADLPEPILNTYNNGSAIYFYNYPKRVFIDSRGLPNDLLKDYLFFMGKDTFKLEDVPGYGALLDTYGIKTIVLPVHHVAIVRMLYYLKGWELLYLDNSVYIFCRNNAVDPGLIRSRQEWQAWARKRSKNLYKKILTEQEGRELNTYGRVFLFLNMLEEARKLFFAASTASPWDAGHWHNLSLSYFMEKNLFQAYICAYRAYRLEPQSIKHQVGLLLAAHEQGIVEVESDIRSKLLDFFRVHEDAFEDVRTMFKFALGVDIKEVMEGGGDDGI